MHNVFEGICCLPLQGSLLRLEIKDKMFLGNVWAYYQTGGLSPECVTSGFRREVEDSCALLGYYSASNGRDRLKCDGTRAETRFRLSAKRTSQFKSAGASVQTTAGIRGVRISGSNAGYTMFRGSVKGTGYPLHSPVSPSLLLPCVTVCHHISTGLPHLHRPRA